MKKLGFYTGHVYDPSDDIQECAIAITDEQAKSVADQNKIYEVQHKNCKGCYGCPTSRGEN